MAVGLILMRDQLRLDTRQKAPIANSLDRRAPTPGEIQQAADYRGRYSSATHRPTRACHTYNCHGLTFASRRTGISDGAEVQKILTDDGYQQVQYRDVSPGDIVIYVSVDTNEIEHSGIIVQVDNYGPKVLSKWGYCHEVIHRLGECEYDATHVRFYRMTQ
jgi:hypothetical protein